MNIIHFPLLKDKLRHIKIYESLIKDQLQSGSTKCEVVRRAALTGARGDIFIKKIGSKTRTLFDWL